MSLTRIDDLRSADGTRLAFYRSAPPDASRGDVLIVGGLAEHAGRYPHVARALGDAGWRSHYVDFRGHGQSDGQRGHVDDWARYVEDLRAALAHAVLEANKDRVEQTTTGDTRKGRQTWVYRRDKQPCRRCGTRIRVDMLGREGQERATYWCPRCQPEA